MDYTLNKSNDGTIRIDFKEGYSSVIIPSRNEKYAVCVSSQIGCPMGCVFCRAGKFKRNLTDLEILEQTQTAAKIIGTKPTSVVFMGMGEPMLNFENVKSAVDLIHNEFYIAYNRITVSTSGVHLEKLFELPCNVAVSLHSPFDAVRKKLMPNAAPIKEIVKFAEEYSKLHKKNVVMIEYAMIKGINDSGKDLKKLMALGWPKGTYFNLIQFNAKDKLKPAEIERMHEFKKVLIDSSFKCFVRLSRGSDIDAACGMLDYR